MHRNTLIPYGTGSVNVLQLLHSNRALHYSPIGLGQSLATVPMNEIPPYINLLIERDLLLSTTIRSFIFSEQYYNILSIYVYKPKKK